MENKKKYKWNKYWWLGLLGFVGFYKLPIVIDAFNGVTAQWKLVEVLWFCWFLYLVPSKNKEE